MKKINNAQNSKNKFYGEKDQMVNHKIRKCNKPEQMKYKTRWEM